MKVAVIGTTGLIGSAVCARLVAEGLQVIGILHTKGSRCFSCADEVFLDLGKADQSEWAAALAGVQAVVNCAGALQDSATEDVSSVHAKGASALFAACERAGVRRIMHFSAIGGRPRSTFGVFGDEAGRRRGAGGFVYGLGDLAAVSGPRLSGIRGERTCPWAGGASMASFDAG